MSPWDDHPPDPSAVARHHLQHDLLSPLTNISGRAQLLTRMVRRSSSLTELERGAMLDGLAIIQEAVRVQAAHIDAFGCEDPNGRVHDEMLTAPEPENPAL